MSAVNGRADVPVVGPLSRSSITPDQLGLSDTVFMMAISSLYPDKYYIAVRSEGTGNFSTDAPIFEELGITLPQPNLIPFITFSAGYFGSGIQNILTEQRAVYFRIRTVQKSNGNYVASLGMYYDAYGVQYIGDFSTIYFLYPETDTRVIDLTLTPYDNADYAYSTLLTGVRYRYNSSVYIHDCRPLSGQLSGLCEIDNSPANLIAINSYVMTFWPTTMFKNGSCSVIDEITGYIPNVMNFAQCMALEDAQFGKSIYCSNIETGFTSLAQCRLEYPLYITSPSCGSRVDTVNFNRQIVSYDTSLGDCTNGVCVFQNELFSCKTSPISQELIESIVPSPSIREVVIEENKESNSILLIIESLTFLIVVIALIVILIVVATSKKDE